MTQTLDQVSSVWPVLGGPCDPGFHVPVPATGTRGRPGDFLEEGEPDPEQPDLV